MRRANKLFKSAALFLAFALMLSLFPVIPSASALEGETKTVVIDGNVLDENPANRFKGFGAINCNNTGRLLMDYKEEHPDEYWETMRLLFDPDEGAGISHVKIEMGNDTDTSSGTEPATMRSADERANVWRGMGFHFAADARSINPKVEISILRWAPPRWVQTSNGAISASNYENCYKWYKETAIALYEDMGLYLDYICPDQNEIGTPDYAFIIWFGDRMRADPEFPNYDKIKIVTDQNQGTAIPTNYLSGTYSEGLQRVVDVIGYHYNMGTTRNYLSTNINYNREIWYSEGVATQSNAKYRAQRDDDVNFGGCVSTLGIMNRYIGMYTHGRRTFYIFQPAISAMYSSQRYAYKEILEARTPWNGSYLPDASIWGVMHFTQFAGIDESRVERTGEGWYIAAEFDSNGLTTADSASDAYGNQTTHGSVGTSFSQIGDSCVDGQMTNAEYNRMTYVSPDKKDFSTVMVNDSDRVANFAFVARNIGNAGAPAQLWETRGPDAGQEYDANWYKMIAAVPAVDNGDGTYTYNITVKARSMATLTTTTVNPNTGNARTEYARNDGIPEDTALDMSTAEDPYLMYEDDFEYAEYPVDENGMTYLERRGNTPRYTSDRGGAFEVAEGEGRDGGNAVMQQLLQQPPTWGTTNFCATVLGDSRWTNYKASIDFKLDMDNNTTATNFATLGVRHWLALGNTNTGVRLNVTDFGYKLTVQKSGAWNFYKGTSSVASGTIEDFDSGVWHTMSVRATDNVFVFWADGVKLGEYTDNSSYMAKVGEVMLGSSLHNTLFDNLKVEKVDGYAPYFTELVDDMDARIDYTNTWSRLSASGAANSAINYEGGINGERFNRTASAANGAPAAGDVTVSKNTIGSQQSVVGTWYYGGSGSWGNYTDHWNSTNGAWAEFTFHGTSVSIAGNRGTDKVNASEYTVTLDGQPVVDGENGASLISLNGSSSTGYTFITIPNLANGQHTVRITLDKESGSTNGLSIYSATYYNTQVGEAAPTPVLTLPFTGTGFDIIGETGATSAIAVYVDGELIDESAAIPNVPDASASRRNTSYSLRGLDYGEHELRIEVLTGTFRFDAIGVMGEVFGASVGAITVDSRIKSLVNGCAANIPVEVTGVVNPFGQKLYAGFFVDGVLTASEEAVNGKAVIKAPAFEGESCYVAAYFEDGEPMAAAGIPIANPVDLWTPAAVYIDGAVYITFSEDISLNSAKAKATVGGVNAVSLEQSGGRTLRIVTGAPVEGETTAVVAGVRYPDLFPSYSFTFTLAIE